MNKDTTFSIMIIVVVIVFFGWIVASSPSDILGTQPTESIVESTTLEYTIIDGMPCLRDQGYRQGGITCDWTKWNGEIYIDGNGTEQIRIKQ